MNVLLLILFGALAQFGEPPGAETNSTRSSAPLPAGALRARRLRSPSITTERFDDAWRYLFHQGRWWYWSPSERWSYFDGKRWVGLDLLNQPRTVSRELAQRDAERLRIWPRTEDLRLRFGKLAVPRSRAGSFDFGSASPATGRNIAGSFEGDAALPHAVISAPSEPATAMPNPYGPDSNYGAYGSTNPLRGGLHIGAGGHFGYGLGAERPAKIGGSTQVAPFNQSR